MPRACLLLGATWLLLCGSVQAEPQPYDAAISAPEVEVRSGPSAKFYATGKLRQGQQVHVIGTAREDETWLAITPPPGSFNWINDQFVERHGQTGMVLAQEGAPTRVGSSLVNQHANVESRIKLPRGAQVALLPGQPMIDGGKWWPILPPPQEVRYIPRDAVKATPAVERVQQPPEVLWQQAEQALKNGNSEEARRLYTLLAAQTASLQYKSWAESRLQYLAQTKSGATGQLTSQPGQQTQSAYGAAPANSVQSTPGRLMRLGFFIDGQPAYVLEDSSGRALLYVTSGPGINLDLYVSRIVTLGGPVARRADLPVNFMTASQVQAVSYPPSR